MARVKGKAFRPTRRRKAQERMKIVLIVFAVLTLLNGGRMLINAVAGPMGKAGVIEQLGGVEKIAEMSKADLQRPYFTYVNEKMDKAKTPIGKVIGSFDNAGCFLILWKTSTWMWGVKATVGFTLGLFYELFALAICVPLYLHFRRIATEKVEKKTEVDVQKEINQKFKEEAKEAERHKGDPNYMTDEEWEKKQEEIMLRKKRARWKEKK